MCTKVDLHVAIELHQRGSKQTMAPVTPNGARENVAKFVCGSWVYRKFNPSVAENTFQLPPCDISLSKSD